MASVLKVSDAAALGLHAMALLATKPDRRLPNPHIASVLHSSAAHLSKVLQRLAKAGLVRATRGPKGGFQLAPGGESLTLLQVYEAIEGPLAPQDCLLGSPICNGRHCIFGELLGRVNREVREYLAGTRLSDLTAVFDAKRHRPRGKSSRSTRRNKEASR